VLLAMAAKSYKSQLTQWPCHHQFSKTLKPNFWTMLRPNYVPKLEDTKISLKVFVMINYGLGVVYNCA
jgi:hypothetical protein